MKSKFIKILSIVVAPVAIILSLSVFGFAQPQHGYRISDYEVIVKIANNGDVDVTEKVKYSFLGKVTMQ